MTMNDSSSICSIGYRYLKNDVDRKEMRNLCLVFGGGSLRSFVVSYLACQRPKRLQLVGGQLLEEATILIFFIQLAYSEC